MRVVVSDTSPVNYLVQIDEIDVLRTLYGEILIPPAVYRELLHPKAPAKVREWAVQCPAWVTIVEPIAIIDHEGLDQGELEAISIASSIEDSLLLIDERNGRSATLSQGIRISGTLSVLEEADILGFVEFMAAIAKLKLTSFRVHPEVLADFTNRVTQRKLSSGQ